MKRGLIVALVLATLIFNIAGVIAQETSCNNYPSVWQRLFCIAGLKGYPPVVPQTQTTTNQGELESVQCKGCVPWNPTCTAGEQQTRDCPPDTPDYCRTRTCPSSTANPLAGATTPKVSPGFTPQPLSGFSQNAAAQAGTPSKCANFGGDLISLKLNNVFDCAAETYDMTIGGIKVYLGRAGSGFKGLFTPLAQTKTISQPLTDQWKSLNPKSSSGEWNGYIVDITEGSEVSPTKPGLNCDMALGQPTREMYMFCDKPSYNPLLGGGNPHMICTGGCIYNSVVKEGIDKQGKKVLGGCWGIVEFEMELTPPAKSTDTTGKAILRCADRSKQQGNPIVKNNLFDSGSGKGSTNPDCPTAVVCTRGEGTWTGVWPYPSSISGNNLLTQNKYKELTTGIGAEGGNYVSLADALPTKFSWEATFSGFGGSITGCDRASGKCTQNGGNGGGKSTGGSPFDCTKHPGFNIIDGQCTYAAGAGASGSAQAQAEAEKKAAAQQDCTQKGGTWVEDHCVPPTTAGPGASASAAVTPPVSTTPADAAKNAVREALGLQKPAHCTNKILDGDETSLDCGGSCGGCDICRVCRKDSDCKTGACGKARGVIIAHPNPGCVGIIGVCYTVYPPKNIVLKGITWQGTTISIAAQGFAWTSDLILGPDGTYQISTGPMYGSPDKNPTPNPVVISAGGGTGAPKSMSGKATTSDDSVHATVTPTTLPDGSPAVEVGITADPTASGKKTVSVDLAGTDANGKTSDMGTVNINADVHPASENPSPTSTSIPIATIAGISTILLGILAAIGFLIWKYVQTPPVQ